MFGPRSTSSRFASQCFVVSLLASLFCTTLSLADDPLHQRIDQEIHSGVDAATIEVCSDSEFIRRIYLDLVGMIPTADETRAFLDDKTADKRVKLVDQLLADPRYARHMATSFDIMLMERRGDKHIKTPAWQQYLYTSFAENKPYDQLAREILEADGVDDKLRSPARFYLDREGETHLLTRDVGRTFFGRDMQCAQCHDHPMIDDYLQRDYYGIFAFLNRSYLFADKKAKKSVFAEKAEGDAKFQSVFDESSKGVMNPKLPGDAEITEPVFKKGEEYAIKPAKDVRPVPKHSRRQLLAEHATTGKNQAFNRNIANRLWALMMGRGLVEPVDLHHADNPPTQPELMQELADRFVAMKFDMKAFIRELALSRTYQRPLELPKGVAAQATAAAQQSAELTAQGQQLAKSIEQHQASLKKLADDVKTAQDSVAPLQAELAKASKPVADAQKAVDAAQKLLDEAQKKLAAKQDVGNLLDEATKKAADATKKPAVAKDVPAGAKALGDDEASIKKAIEQRTAAVKTATDKLAALQKVADEIQARLAPAQEQLTASKAAREAAQTKLRADQSAAKQIERKQEEIQVLVNYGKTLATGAVPEVSPQQVAKLTEAKKSVEQLSKSLASDKTSMSAATATSTKSKATLAASQKQLVAQREAGKLIAAALTDLQQAQTKLPADAELSQVAQGFKQRSDRLSTEITAAEKTIASLQQAIKTADAQAVTAQQSLDAHTAALAASQKSLAALNAQTKPVPQTASTGSQAEAELTELWTEKFLVASLKPLSPEQLSWSMMQASGMVSRQQTAAVAKVDNPPKPKPKKGEKKAEPAKAPQPLTPEQRTQAIEQQVYNGLKGNLGQYITLFSAGAGQPQNDFFATVDQALYFANGGRVATMFAPSGENFTAKAIKATDPQVVAEEVYLSVLSRRPTPEEVTDVKEYLAPREKDRVVALQEIVWGLVTSAEFRFNH